MKNSIKIAALTLFVGLSISGVQAADRQNINDSRNQSNREVSAKSASNDAKMNCGYSNFDRNHRGVTTILSSRSQGLDKGDSRRSPEVELKKKPDSRESENRLSNDNTTSKSKW